MFDQWQNDITEETDETDDDIQKIPISQGVITKITIDFPFGCENLAHCRLSLGATPLIPRRAKGYVNGNGVQIDTGEIREPTRGQNPILLWHCWNLDEEFSHELTLSITWRSKLPEDDLIFNLQDMTATLKRFITLIVGREA